MASDLSKEAVARLADRHGRAAFNEQQMAAETAAVSLENSRDHLNRAILARDTEATLTALLTENERLRGHLRQIAHNARPNPALEDRQRFGLIYADAMAALEGSMAGPGEEQ